MDKMNLIIFTVSVLSVSFILILSLISAASRSLYFFPPPSRNSWQYLLFWVLFRVMFVGLVVLSFTSFNASSNAVAWLRYYLGLPFLIGGFATATYLSMKLGWKNAHGEQKGLVVTGFYRWSRNPIYVASIFGMIGWGLLVQSIYVHAILFLWCFLYILAPFIEEPWLQERYGNEYLAYKSKVPRFFSLSNKT